MALPRPRTVGSPPLGLDSLNDLKNQYEIDKKRANASIALLRSGQLRVSGLAKSGPSDDNPAKGRDGRKSYSNGFSAGEDDDDDGIDLGDDDDGELLSLCKTTTIFEESPEKFRRPVMLTVEGEELDKDGDGVITLDEAFLLHANSFDSGAENVISMDNLVALFEACSFLDEWLTPLKMRVYLTTLSEGCNCMPGQPPLKDGDQGVGYEQFEALLRWAANLKGVEYTACVAKVVTQARRMSSTSGSMRQKLQIVFETFSKTNAGYMSWLEFASLCRRMDVYNNGHFTVADTYSLFNNQAGRQVDFEGFLDVAKAVGEKLGIGSKIFQTFAEIVSNQDKDQETLRRIRMRIRSVVTTVEGRDWNSFFYDTDIGNTGVLSWAEFHDMCRKKLHLADSVPHIRLLFERLDQDGSEEVSITEFLEFIAEDPFKKASTQL